MVDLDILRQLAKFDDDVLSAEYEDNNWLYITFKPLELVSNDSDRQEELRSPITIPRSLFRISAAGEWRAYATENHPHASSDLEEDMGDGWKGGRFCTDAYGSHIDNLIHDSDGNEPLILTLVKMSLSSWTSGEYREPFDMDDVILCEFCDTRSHQHEACDNCGKEACANCYRCCYHCSSYDYYCPECYTDCQNCGSSVCDEHIHFCETCQMSVCESCEVEGGCKACMRECDLCCNWHSKAEIIYLTCRHAACPTCAQKPVPKCNHCGQRTGCSRCNWGCYNCGQGICNNCKYITISCQKYLQFY